MTAVAVGRTISESERDGTINNFGEEYFGADIAAECRNGSKLKKQFAQPSTRKLMQMTAESHHGHVLCLDQQFWTRMIALILSVPIR